MFQGQNQADDDTILEITSKFRDFTHTLRQELKDLQNLRKGSSSKEDEAYQKLYSSVMFDLSSVRSNHRALYTVFCENSKK